MCRKLFAAVLLLGVLAMNASVYCQSLCIGGHGAHSTRGAVVQHPPAHHGHHAANCDLSHSAARARADCPRSGDEESLKCDCSGELTVVYGYHLLVGAPPVHSPVATQVARLVPSDSTYHSPDTPPAEGPPKITA